MELSEKEEKIILALNRDGDREYKAGELIETTGLAERTFYYNLDKLKEKDLASSPRQGKHKLTEEGKETSKKIEDPAVMVEPEAQNKRVKGLEDRLPSKPHVALFEQAISVVYAKQNFFGEFEKGWPGFVIYGPTKTYKTSLCEVIIKTLGLDPEASVKNLETATSGEIGVRHRKAEGGDYVPDQSFIVDHPVFCFDELDKADKGVRDAVKIYLQSKRSDTVEGEKIDLKTVPLVTLNIEDIKDELPDPFLRRSYVFDTRGLGIQEDIDLVAQKVAEYLGGPLFNLNRSKEKPGFPSNLYERLRDLYRPFLKDGYWKNETDVRPVLITLKGRIISPLSSDSLEEDLVNTVYHTLTLDETRRGTVDNWRREFAQQADQLIEDEQLAEAIQKKERQKKEAEKKKAKMEEKRTQNKDQEAEDFLQEKLFERDKGNFLAEVENYAEQFKHTGSQKLNREVKPVREALRDLANEAEKKIVVPEDIKRWRKKYEELKGELKAEQYLDKKRKKKESKEKKNSKPREYTTLEKKLLEQIRKYQGRKTTKKNEDVLSILKDMFAIRILRQGGKKEVKRNSQGQNDWAGLARELVQVLGDTEPRTFYDPGAYEGINGTVYHGTDWKWQHSATRSLLDDFEQIIKDREFNKNWAKEKSKPPVKSKKDVMREQLYS